MTARLELCCAHRAAPRPGLDATLAGRVARIVTGGLPPCLLVPSGRFALGPTACGCTIRLRAGPSLGLGLWVTFGPIAFGPTCARIRVVTFGPLAFGAVSCRTPPRPACRYIRVAPPGPALLGLACRCVPGKCIAHALHALHAHHLLHAHFPCISRA